MSDEDPRPGPLAGVRIVDLTANMAGPYATQVLGDQGADVIKVEPPGGDVSRTMGNGVAGYSAFYANLNRSKRGLTLDLAHPEVGRVLGPLLDRADVVVDSHRPATARRLGLDEATVRAGRPTLIHATVSGFGSVGPYGGRPAYDHIIQALTGFAATQADPDTGTPALVRQGVVDKLVGQTTAQAITAALFERTRTGIGRAIEVRMLDAAIAFLWPDVMMNHTATSPTVTRPSITSSFRLTPTTDGHVAYAVVTDRQFDRLSAALGLEPGLGRGAVHRAARRRLADCTTDEGVDLLAGSDIPVAPVTSLESLHDHPQARATGAVDVFEHAVLGTVRQPSPAARFDAEVASSLRPAPLLGEHRQAIATEAGLDAGEVERLAAAGVFGTPG